MVVDAGLIVVNGDLLVVDSGLLVLDSGLLVVDGGLLVVNSFFFDSPVCLWLLLSPSPFNLIFLGRLMRGGCPVFALIIGHYLFMLGYSDIFLL